MAVAMPAISLFSTLAGGAMSAMSAISSGNAQAANFGYQSQLATINSQIAQQNKQYALTSGETELRQYGMKAAQRSADIVTAQSGSGLDLNSGTLAGVRDSQQYVTRMDENQIAQNTQRKAQAYEIDSQKNLAQASMYNSAASNAKKSGMLGALSSIIGTASSVADKWMYASKLGMLGNADRRYVDVGSAIQVYG